MSRTPENHTRCISPDQPYSPSYYPGSGEQDADVGAAACAAAAVGSKRKDDGAEENAEHMQLLKSKKLRVDSDAAAASCVGSKVPEGMLDPFDEEILNGDREANLALKVRLSFLL